jgi:hypothetical protein
MRTFLLTVLAVFTAALGAGCASGAAADDSGPLGGTAGVAGSAHGDLPSSITLAVPDMLDARAQVEVAVQVVPAGSYRVRFSLPAGDDAEPRDAVLDRSEASTNSSGQATVLLTAPSSEATFKVRASVGSVATTATIMVKKPELGEATLQVQAVLLGHRKPTSWVATVHEQKTCVDVPGIPPPDGALAAFAAAPDAVELRGVKTGVPLAVVLRSGFFMGGCQTVEMLPPEAAQARTLVSVGVLDRPMDLTASTLSLSLGLSEPGPSWAKLTSAAGVAVSGALLGETSLDDVDALLDAMQSSLKGTPLQNFQNARLDESWDSLVQARWGSSTKLTDLVSGWLEAGSSKLTAGEQVFVGQLSAVDADSAKLSLDTVAGIAAAHAGFGTDAQVSWSAGSDDTVVLSTNIYFFSSQLLTALSEPDVLAQHDVDSMPEALAAELACAALGSDLAGAGSDPLLAYPGCSASCVSELCAGALETIWQRGRDATALSPVQLSVTAAGAGRVGEHAELAGVSGTWVGKLITDDAQDATGGVLTAAEPPLEAL